MLLFVGCDKNWMPRRSLHYNHGAEVCGVAVAIDSLPWLKEMFMKPSVLLIAMKKLPSVMTSIVRVNFVCLQL